MKDTEFIDLLNLYLDHEISPADAARLEAEVQTNAARRRIYQQYCRMQKACKMVAADFTSEAEVAGAAHEKKVVAFDPDAVSAAVAARKRSNTFYTVGTFAALAACVAVIFVKREQAGVSPTSDQVATHVAASPAGQVNHLTASPNVSAPRGLVSVAPRPAATLVANPLFLTGNTQAQAVFAATVRQVDDQLAWLNSVKMPPLEQRAPSDNNDLLFAATLSGEGRALGNRSNLPTKQKESAEEAVGFQFVK
jgi:hypothetical protein